MGYVVRVYVEHSDYGAPIGVMGPHNPVFIYVDNSLVKFPEEAKCVAKTKAEEMAIPGSEGKIWGIEVHEPGTCEGGCGKIVFEYIDFIYGLSDDEWMMSEKCEECKKKETNPLQIVLGLAIVTLFGFLIYFLHIS